MEGAGMTIIEIIERLEKKAGKELLAGAQKDKMLKQLAALKAKYGSLAVIDEESPIIQGLVEKGTKLVAQPFSVDAANLFSRYAKAALYDLSGNLLPYKWYVRLFFISAIGFFLLAPQFFPVIFALIFIVPVFVGLRGLKTRTVNGFTLTAMIFPVSLLSASMAAKAFIPAVFGNLSGYAQTLSEQFRVSAGTASILVVVFAIVSLVTITSSIAGAVIGFLYKDMFV